MRYTRLDYTLFQYKLKDSRFYGTIDANIMRRQNMANDFNCRIDHSCMIVSDIDWYLRFFQEACGMSVSKSIPEQGKYWMAEGIQINKGEAGGVQGVDHIGLGCTDLEAQLDRIYAFPEVKALPQGRQWVLLPEGQVLEIVPR